MSVRREVIPKLYDIIIMKGGATHIVQTRRNQEAKREAGVTSGALGVFVGTSDSNIRW